MDSILEGIPEKIKLLLVETNTRECQLVQNNLLNHNEPEFLLFIAKSFKEAFKILSNHVFDVILLDLILPDKKGLDVLLEIKPYSNETPIIVLSTLDNEITALRAVKEGAQDYLICGEVNNNSLRRAIFYAIERSQLLDEMRNLNNKLQSANQELQKLNNDKDKFYSLLSHDLKNPFQSLLNNSNELMVNSDKMEKKEIKAIAFQLNSACRHLFRLLDNLLNWSQLQLGMEPQKNIINIEEIISENIGLLFSNASKKNVHITWDIKDNTNVFADRNMAQSILLNLISNAIKITPPNGRVHIKTHRCNGMVEVEVSDTGTGIPMNIQEKIFKFDTHTAMFNSAREKGIGLGLLICYEFVRKHGGKIWVDSKPGKGSAVRFTLPAA